MKSRNSWNSLTALNSKSTTWFLQLRSMRRVLFLIRYKLKLSSLSLERALFMLFALLNWNKDEFIVSESKMWSNKWWDSLKIENRKENKRINNLKEKKKWRKVWSQYRNKKKSRINLRMKWKRKLKIIKTRVKKRKNRLKRKNKKLLKKSKKFESQIRKTRK